MKIDDDEKHIVMNDGTRYYAFSGRLSIDPEGPSIYYGYDGWISEFDGETPPKEHQREIADYMIALWTKYRKEYGA